LPDDPRLRRVPTQITLALGWELDFWGKFRRATESARATLLSEEWAQRQIVSSLVSDIASAYFQLRELSNMRYRGGAASYLEVLDSETRFFDAQLALAQAELRELQSLVQIYRSLGGGWQQ
jgi:multidrug efflux system outer membrane protein